MRRRTALKIVTLGALAPGLKTSSYSEAATLWSPDSYQLRFFSEAENQLLDELMEMIIPADSHSPGAHAAKVSLFADVMVATSDKTTQDRWHHGLGLIREEADRSSLAEALAKSAASEDHPLTELEHFFVTLKHMTVNGYYTSAIGIHQDLQYQGNTYLAAFPGCTNQAVMK
jgi:hypothetical protein